MKINIRQAAYEDLHAIYELVVELAVYEKEPDAVSATIEDYQSAFKEGVFEALVAEDSGTIIGICIYYMTYSTWKGKMIYLEDFVVSQNYRQSGVGQLLFDKLIAVSKNKKARLLKWQVLDWNKPAVSFYEKNNAIIEKNWWSGKIIFKT